jgi:tRNA(fMet)-specific endonuclease VapC
MSLYILDTDILTLLQNQDPVVVQNVGAHSQVELAITIISVEEQLSGWYRQLRRAKTSEALAHVYDRLTATVQALAGVRVLSFSKSAIQRYDQLRMQRLNVAKMDLRIAAIVLEHSAILVTRNTIDFQRVPGLQLEDWSK